MLQDNKYPSPQDPHFQTEMYTKKIFYNHSIPHRSPIPDKRRLEKFMETCSTKIKLTEPQSFAPIFINPNTPYTGIILFHGTGTGKSCTSISVAEGFKPMVEKYGTRIHVLVPGPLNKENYMKEIVKCTGDTYTSGLYDKNIILDQTQREKAERQIYGSINQYYRIMSHRSFHKRVLGEKIKQQSVVKGKVVTASRKTESGEYERELSLDRIYNLDNTLLIIDEAHNCTGNDFGNAVKKIITNSKNLKILLLTATPMKDSADSIVELLNYLRPIDAQIMRDRVFTNERGHQMKFKAGGREYLANMARGYVSFLRGGDPLTFAERNDVGEIPASLSFTRVTQCFMLPFQLQTFRKMIAGNTDSFDREAEAVSNFCFPGFGKESGAKLCQGYYGINGISEVKNQLRANQEKLCRLIADTILAEYQIKNTASLMYLVDNKKTITGEIFNVKYLKHFSIKFYTALLEINRLVYGQQGPGLLFVYSNLVRVGIELFQQVLLNNGYLEYQEDASNYVISDSVKCYCCEYPTSRHAKLPDHIPKHAFRPATFIAITGKSDESIDTVHEEKHRILFDVFNKPTNREGKYIKLVLGSRVMNEGITLRNIADIHILDVHFNLGRVDQVIGRGIRFCTHRDMMNQKNLYPKVNIHKYVASIKNEIASEEQLYQNAEKKYVLVKDTELILKQQAIDCALNYSGNVFPEEVKKYKGCGDKRNPCPAICGFMPCDFKCGDQMLNAKFYDPTRNVYKKLQKNELDYSSFDANMAQNEIKYAREKIKELYGLYYVYTLPAIVDYVRQSYPANKQDIFDVFYVYQALHQLLPVTSNDYNNFTDVITDKNGRPGYLIYVYNYYIFQPLREPHNLPTNYRKKYRPYITKPTTIKQYLKCKYNYDEIKQQSKHVNRKQAKTKKYDFETNAEYYEDREEFDIVGIIDSKSVRRVKNNSMVNDEFKIRQKRPKHITKRRETGLASYLGAVCATSKHKSDLVNVCKKINLDCTRNNLKSSVCDMIRDKLFDLEKYSTKAQRNKYTYMITPHNHASIPFPLNLEDRVQYIKDELASCAGTNPSSQSKSTQGTFPDIQYVEYTIQANLSKYPDLAAKHKATRKTATCWQIMVK